MPSLADLERLTLRQRRVLEDRNSDCTIHINLTEPVFIWEMDHPEIQSKADEIGSKRCDFSVRQIKNPNDEKTHLILIECKKNVRVEDEEINYIHGQIEGGLNVLCYLVGGRAHLSFDRLTAILVVPKYYTGGISNKHFHQLPIKYNSNRTARIKVEDEDDITNGIKINDNYVVERGSRK